jgi:REP element-mobilizing transposase RayT
MPMPTYFLTFTTHGTWLHGDERGSTERRGKHKRGKTLPPDLLLEAANRRRMKHPPLTLDAGQRGCVRRAVEDDCDFRKRTIVALAVRTNHVHLVVEAMDPIESVLQNVKAWATRRLHEKELVQADRPIWTESGNKIVLRDVVAVTRAVDYVKNQQGEALPEV